MTILFSLVPYTSTSLIHRMKTTWTYCII